MEVVVHLYVFMNLVRPLQRQQRLLGDGQPQIGGKDIAVVHEESRNRYVRRLAQIVELNVHKLMFMRDSSLWGRPFFGPLQRVQIERACLIHAGPTQLTPG